MRARISQQPKSAMQSGTAGSTQWVLDWEPGQRQLADPLMGWIGGGTTQAQVHVHFATKEEAIAYAERHNIPYDLELPPPRRPQPPKVYADNFKYGRVGNWTH